LIIGKSSIDVEVIAPTGKLNAIVTHFFYLG